MTRRAKLRLLALEARDVPSGNRLFALGEDGSSRVAVYEATGPSANLQGSGRLLASFDAFPGFTGGTRVALGDITGDGIEDLVVAAGPGGGPHVKVYDGSDLLAGQVTLIASFFAFNAGFRGGVNIAVGQMDPGPGGQEIIVGAGAGGGAHVRIFAMDKAIYAIIPGTEPPDYYFPRMETQFFAFDSSFRGGVRVAAADVTGDGTAELIAAAGPGGGPHVRVFDVPPPNPLALPPYRYSAIDEFFAYSPNFHGGVYVAAGELNGDSSSPEIVTGAGEGGAPHVRVWGKSVGAGRLSLQSQFFARSSRFTNGVRIGIGNLGSLPDRQSIYAGVALPIDIAFDFYANNEPRITAYTFAGSQFVEQRQYVQATLGPYHLGVYPSL